jgi:hypothetical protein
MCEGKEKSSMTVAFGIFVVLHGLVHLLYFGHSSGRFQLKPGMTWPGGAWALSRAFGDDAIRTIASIAMILAALGLVGGGIGFLTGQEWRRPVIAAAAGFSSVAYLLLWNGRLQNLDGQGAVGVLINVLILVAVLVLRWP